MIIAKYLSATHSGLSGVDPEMIVGEAEIPRKSYTNSSDSRAIGTDARTAHVTIVVSHNLLTSERRCKSTPEGLCRSGFLFSRF